MLTLTDATIDQINDIGRFRFPNEAVGLIAKRRVLELPNRSLDAEHAFTVFIEDIPILLEVNNIEMTEKDWEEIVLWHTHPRGRIGPSRTDMQNKAEHFIHLVVAITSEGPVATFY